MAQKRTLSAGEQHQLRETLQAATIAALMDSRRWQPGELAFQGGTCLHLAHGSVRFSEDLDFMVRGGLPLGGLPKEVLARLRLPPGVAQDLVPTITAAKDNRNPHAFIVTLSGPNVIGSAKVKIELWNTSQDAIADLKLMVSQIRSEAGIQSYVPTLTLAEILADKVYALGARDRIKPRDIYDLWWIKNNKSEVELDPNGLLLRLDIYPALEGGRKATACRWIESANRNMQHLTSPAQSKLVAMDLKRWLPSSVKMNEEVAQEMIDASIGQLAAGQKVIQGFADDESCKKMEMPRG